MKAQSAETDFCNRENWRIHQTIKSDAITYTHVAKEAYYGGDFSFWSTAFKKCNHHDLLKEGVALLGLFPYKADWIIQSLSLKTGILNADWILNHYTLFILFGFLSMHNMYFILYNIYIYLTFTLHTSPTFSKGTKNNQYAVSYLVRLANLALSWWCSCSPSATNTPKSGYIRSKKWNGK